MYAPRGGIHPELGDVEVFPHGDQLHLFHLTLPNHDVVQHAVSDDGLSWRALPPALFIGQPGECDDDMIWTMSVTERGGTFFMLYTALARAEEGRVQRTALATSTDLIHWVKHPGNPVAEADPRWYEADPAGRVSWRDPKPLLVGDTYYATVDGRERAGPIQRRGCAALMVSRDLVTWDVRPPLFAPRRYWDLECPQLFTVDGHLYLTAAIMEDRLQHYWTAPGIEGPFAVPPDGGVLAPEGHYAGRVCRWRGHDLFYCWHKADYDWPVRNPFGKYVPAPLALARDPDGSLRRGSFPGWSDYRERPPARLAPDEATLYRGLPRSGWELASPSGMDVLATADDLGDFMLEGTLLLSAPAGGLAFRLDADGGGYVVELGVESREVSLQKWLAPRDRVAYGYTVAQRGRLRHPLAADRAVAVRLLSVGPYVEVEIDGAVALATLTAERLSGRVGIWADSGSIDLRDARWSPMRRPTHA